MPSPTPLKGFPVESRPGYGPYAGYVDYVQDGDTLNVVLDPGFDHYPCVAIRLESIEAPEINQDGGEASRDHLDGLLPYGTPVLVRTKKRPRSGRQEMTFTRYVGTVCTIEDGRDVGEVMVADGYAVRVT